MKLWVVLLGEMGFIYMEMIFKVYDWKAIMIELERFHVELPKSDIERVVTNPLPMSSFAFSP